MKINYFSYFITLSLIITSTARSIIPSTIKVEFPDAIKVKPDFSGISEESGKMSQTITQEVSTGIMKGISQAAQSSEFHQAASDIFKGTSQQTASAFAEAMKDPRLRKEIAEGTGAITKTMGVGAERFATGLEQDVFPHISRMFAGAISSIYNIENAIRFGGPIALSATISLAGIYGSRVFWNVLEKRLLNPKPQIILPRSVYGRTDRIKRWLTNYKTPTMIFDQQIKDRLIEIKEVTKNIRDQIRNGKQITYNNLLLYGKPGTGKTLFAQILADETNMDFLPVTAASLLQSGVEGIKYFDELLEMAKRSKYGVIIFVDEADGLFIDRDSLYPSSDHYKVFNHILASIKGSDKFMFVAATNHAYIIDPAMGRRFQDRVLMPLPDPETRKELLHLYLEQNLFNSKINNTEFISAAKKIITPTAINGIVNRTNGLSHAEIGDMVTAIYKKASATRTGMITAKHVESAVSEAIEKKRAQEKDKEKRESKQR